MNGIANLDSEVDEDRDDDASAPRLTLRHLTFSLSRGQFGVVVGAVGAGKSSLLRACLGELWVAQEHARNNQQNPSNSDLEG